MVVAVVTLSITVFLMLMITIGSYVDVVKQRDKARTQQKAIASLQRQRDRLENTEATLVKQIADLTAAAFIRDADERIAQSDKKNSIFIDELRNKREEAQLTEVHQLPAPPNGRGRYTEAP